METENHKKPISIKDWMAYVATNPLAIPQLQETAFLKSANLPTKVDVAPGHNTIDKPIGTPKKSANQTMFRKHPKVITPPLKYHPQSPEANISLVYSQEGESYSSLFNY